jgi:hypothetical protein
MIPYFIPYGSIWNIPYLARHAYDASNHLPRQPLPTDATLYTFCNVTQSDWSQDDHARCEQCAAVAALERRSRTPAPRDAPCRRPGRRHHARCASATSTCRAWCPSARMRSCGCKSSHRRRRAPPPPSRRGCAPRPPLSPHPVCAAPPGPLRGNPLPTFPSSTRRSRTSRTGGRRGRPSQATTTRQSGTRRRLLRPSRPWRPLRLGPRSASAARSAAAGVPWLWRQSLTMSRGRMPSRLCCWLHRVGSV